jgi:hypothetical protein
MNVTKGPVRRRSFLKKVGAALALPAFSRADNALNSQPNPYRLVLNWAKLPEGMKWGQVVAIDFDRDGDIYVFHRSEPGILKFSPDGKLLKNWGEGMFVMAHGLTVDRFGYIWTADSDTKDGRGGQVFKYDSNGKLLMSLGAKGVSAESPTGESFVAPTGVAVGANGDVFVSDGHHNPPHAGNHRILKFSQHGKFIKAWGKLGSMPGEINDPHAIAINSQGRLLIADRRNRRVQVFGPEGDFVAAWPQFGSVENLYIGKGDVLYVTDANSQTRSISSEYYAPYTRGIRVGSARDGSINYFIPEESWDPAHPTPASSGPVALGADPKGNVYVADVGTTVGFDRMMKKYVR